MASPDVEINVEQLNEEQREALQQYTSVTDQDLDAALHLLQRCEWNIQIAIARFFDGEPAAIASLPPPQSARRQETLANPFQDLQDLQRSSRSRLEAAPRVVSQPESQINQQPSFILSFLLTPANLVYSIFTRVFGVLSRFFPFLPGLLSRLTYPTTSHTTSTRRPLGPQDTTARFLREFEEEYGAHNLPFLETGYARAFDLAKRDLKFLLVVPLSLEHDDTPAFIQSLLSEPVITFLNDSSNNIMIWAGTIQDSEAYQVASAFNFTKFPAAALVVHTPSVSATAMSVVARVAGPISSEQLIAKLCTAIDGNSAPLDGVRATRAEQQAGRNLREQQNSAYERSLAQDRERVRLRKEKEELAARGEREEKEKEEAAKRYVTQSKQWRRWRASRLDSEPPIEAKDAARISLRLLDGERVTRRFWADAGIEEVYAFVECFDEIKARTAGRELEEKEPREPIGFTYTYAFRLVSPLPREAYEIAAGGTVRERIGRSGNLIVERVESDELDEENEAESVKSG